MDESSHTPMGSLRSIITTTIVTNIITIMAILNRPAVQAEVLSNQHLGQVIRQGQGMQAIQDQPFLL